MAVKAYQVGFFVCDFFFFSLENAVCLKKKKKSISFYQAPLLEVTWFIYTVKYSLAHGNLIACC